MLGHVGLGEDGYPEEQRGIADQRQGHAQGQSAEAETEAAVVHPAQAREHFQRPAQQRNNQRIEPDCRAGGQAGEHAATVGLLPIQRTNHRRGQLSDGGEGDLADCSQRCRGAEQAVADIGEQQDHDDADATYREHPVTERLERALGFLAAQQPGQQHVVGNHGRQCDAGDDYHAGCRRGAADEGEQGEPGMQFGQRQADDEGIRRYASGQQHLSRQRDRDHEYRGEYQIEREHPAGQAEVARLDVLYHRNVKLPWQADDRHHRDGGLDQHG